MTVDVLGTKYEIIQSDKLKDNTLEQHDGYCDFTTKKIVIDTFKHFPGCVEDLDKYRKQVIRHELVHAFLFESGLDSSSWGNNEEIVDWIAIQSIKLFDVFNKMDLI